MATDPKALAERLDRLERWVATVSREIAELRSELGTQRTPIEPIAPVAQTEPVAERTAAADLSAPADRAESLRVDPPRRTLGFEVRTPHHAPSSLDFERLIGRYGTLGLATLTGLAAVGTFVSWAITRGMLGPRVRLGVGVLVAIAVAGVGMRIRPRERSFGAALLGIALAILHVCAWSAGPANLALVPWQVTLALAVGASVALASLAHREEDEPLWCVGFGGAAIAPFVTAGDTGSPLMLTLYGAAVLLLGCWALRGREWPIAGRVLSASGVLYVGALLAAPHETSSPFMALGLPLLVAGAGVVPFASLYMRRGRMRMFGILAAIAALAIADARVLPASDVVRLAALGGAFATWLVLLDVSADLPTGSLLDGLLGEPRAFWDWVDGAIIPLLFLVAAVNTGPSTAVRHGVIAGIVAIAMVLFAFRRSISPLRDAAVFIGCVAALLAVWRAASPAEAWMPAFIAVAGLAFVVARDATPSKSWLPMALVALVLASIGAHERLENRVAYEYIPFLTAASATAAIVTIAWFASGRMLRADDADARDPLDTVRTYASRGSDIAPMVPIVAWGWAFLWVHQELEEAFSPTVATLLRISYYAVTGVVAVHVGRVKGMASLRHLGLVFALIAAAAALRGAATLQEVWARVAGYLVTSGFLLWIAWWYRKTGEAETGE